MSVAVNEADRYYITETCYVLLNTRELVNLDASRKLTGMTWKLLSCLMERHDSIVTYEEILGKLWENKDREQKGKGQNDITQIMYRLRHQCFNAVGVDSKTLENVLMSIPGEGIMLRPHHQVTMPTMSFAGRLLFTGIAEREFSEIIDCLLYLGLSGRMGRERLIKLANDGNRLAALELGELYYYGYITHNRRPDFKTACEWYKKAGDHPVALWSLGYCIMNNFYPVVAPDQIDYLAAKDYFERAEKITTETGVSAAALTSLGILWETGRYPAKDYRETHRFEKQDVARALSYYTMADKMGYHYATNRLGLHYEKRGCAGLKTDAENRQKAFSYFDRSAKLVADGYALNKLGLYCEKGFGCQANPTLACEYFIRGIGEPLEDDRTGWNYFNAGRVYACRIERQPKSYYNLTQAFICFDEALHRLPIRDHAQVLLEMIEIMTIESNSAGIPPATFIQTRAWIERYLASPHANQDQKAASQAEVLRKKALWLEEILSVPQHA